MSEQAELFRADTTWFHVFKAMVDSGEAGEMGSTAFLVYCIIKSHCAFSNGESWPSIETIAKKANVSTRQVIRELQTLEGRGYVRKEKRGRSNAYVLREKVDIMDAAGEPVKRASWDYVPDLVKAATLDLKHVVLTGDFGAARIVHIENLHVEVKQLITGEHNTGIQFNDVDLDTLPEDVRKGLLARAEEARRRALVKK